MDIQYCRRCGAKVALASPGRYVCPNGHSLYYKASPAAGALLLNDKNQVILGVRGIEPDKGKLGVPGGFCELHETCEQAVLREIQEELNLTPDQFTTPEFLCTAIQAYPYEDETHSGWE